MGFWEDNKWKTAFLTGRYSWQKHVLIRLAERGIAQEEALNALLNGECIEEYPSDYPYPCGLFLGWRKNGHPLHVVASFDGAQAWVFIITAYEPDFLHFESDFRKRRKK